MKNATNIAVRYPSSVVALLGLFLLAIGSLMASDTPFGGTPLTTAGNVPPTQSVGLLTGIFNSSGTMTLSWTPVDGAVSYTIDRETISNGTWQPSYASALTGTTYVDSNYGTGGYHYRISAVNSIGVASSPSVEFPQARYAVIDLGSNMVPNALSNTGYILLRGTSNGNYYRWSQGTAHALTLPYNENESTSIGQGISDNGDVAGGIEIYSPYSLTPVIWSGSSLDPTPLTTTALGPDPQDDPDTETREYCIDYNGTIYGDQSETNNHGGPTEQYTVYQGVSWANSGTTASLLAPITVQKVVNNPPFYTQTGTTCVVLNVAKNGHTLGQIEDNVAGTGWVNTVDGIQVSFSPQSLNTDGTAIGTLGGTDVIYQNGVTQSISLPGSSPQPGLFDVNHATRIKHNGDGTTTTVVSPQIIGSSGSIIQLNPDAGLYEDLNLSDLIAPGSGFSSIQCFHINDSGAIVGTATYGGTNTAIASGSHGIMLAPSDYAPAVLKVNSSFNEQKINSTTGYAQPDNYDEDLKIATGHTNAGKITVANLHQNFFGIKPGAMPNSFFQNATVTIKKLDNTDPETGQTERGRVRLYAIQNLGQSGEQAYPIPISNSGQTLTNSTVPFTTSISTDQPANLVSVLYSDSATIPQGSNITYYMEGVDPGPITLEYRIHFTASGSTPDVVVDQSFQVCTQQSKAAWEQDIRQEILLQTGVDMNSYTYTGSISAPFMTDKTYIQATYAYYQELFTQKSTLFGWAGLAKMAGADVYGAMDDAEYGRTVAPAWIPGANIPGNIIGDYVQNTLVKGNYEIFDDLAWQYRAYQASGIWALRYTSSNELDTPAIRPMDLDPWNELYQGDYSATPSLVTEATGLILQREQLRIAQRSWDIFHANSYYVGDTLLSILTSSPLPSGASFTTVMGYSADVTVYNDRWAWINDPTRGMWQQWNGYSNASQVGFAGISLRIYSEGYSLFYDYSQTSYPIIW